MLSDGISWLSQTRNVLLEKIYVETDAKHLYKNVETSNLTGKTMYFATLHQRRLTKMTFQYSRRRPKHVWVNVCEFYQEASYHMVSIGNCKRVLSVR